MFSRTVFFSNAIFLITLFTLCTSCFRIRSSHGGGEIDRAVAERKIDVNDIALPQGYKVEVVAQGLNFPTGVAFDESSNVFIIESGYSYGDEWSTPTLKQIGKNGEAKIIVKGGKNCPWNGIFYYKGNFYVAEGGQLDGGKILRISPSGEVKTLVEGLPSLGDHHTNGPVVVDDYVYFGQGTATNAAVVGNDNADFGWLKRNPDFHDTPCQQITLTGKNYTTDNVLTDDPKDKAVTGAYSPYGEASTKGQVIPGAIPCSGAVMRIPVNGGELQLVAWGFRNPYGLALANDGKLFLTENAYDVRGSRPVWGSRGCFMGGAARSLVWLA